MGGLVHKSGSYSDIEIPDLGELVLPQGKMGEIAAYGRPPGTPERISSYLLTEYLEKLGVDVDLWPLRPHRGRTAGRAGQEQHSLHFGAPRAGRCSRGRWVCARDRKPGVLLTHLGPGLTNAVTGIANAALDSIPMVVIAGDVPSYYYGRHPHQEINQFIDGGQYEVCRPFCKRVYRVDRVEDLPRIMERAFHL